jgi:hypothetical protein
MQSARRSSLDAVEVVHLHRGALVETVRFLQEAGLQGHEGLVLWLGQLEGTTASVQRALVPPQEPIRSEEGVGYFVTAETLFALNRFLNEQRLRLIAQVHSHPTEAYHSETDDRYAIVTNEGGFSLVVPCFARTEHSPEGWAVYRLRGGCWRPLDSTLTRQVFQVVD